MSENKNEWVANTLAPAIKRAPERQERFETESGIELDPLYSSEDIPDSKQDHSFPGEFPYTRGVQPTTVSYTI